MVVKNEADIIKDNLEHHLCKGVSRFIITDNKSTDNTKEILEKYPEVELLTTEDDTHHQSKHVSQMANLACKFKPDWIIHLDADEFCENLMALRQCRGPVVACESLYLHPPADTIFSTKACRYYLDLDAVPLPQECKIAHRPIENITITHGNHGVVGHNVEYTKLVARHHYPIRSSEQWVRKASGHLALAKRNAICERWERWYTVRNSLPDLFNSLVDAWARCRACFTQDDFLYLLSYWCTPEVVEYFRLNQFKPIIREFTPSCRIAS